MEDDAAGLSVPGVSEVVAVNLFIIAIVVAAIAVGVTLGLRALGHVLEQMSERDE